MAFPVIPLLVRPVVTVRVSSPLAVRTFTVEAPSVVVTASDGRSAIATAQREQPDLIVLDIMLPTLDGIEACKEIRKFSSVPIIMLTAKDQEIDKVLALELGADDYVTKPFALHEFLARIKARLRRQLPIQSGHDEAIAHARRVCEIEPNDPFSFTALSVTYQRAYAGTNNMQFIRMAEDAMEQSRMLQSRH